MGGNYEKSIYRQLQEVLERLEQAEKTIQELRLENAQLKDEIARLKGMNSGNSSKPPSSDGFNKPIKMREKSDRPVGGQKGHKGVTKPLYENPDEICEFAIEKCQCGGEIEYSGEYVAKQYVDVEIKSKITEYRSYIGKCSCCGAKVKNQHGLHDRITYGNNLKSLAAMLSCEGNVSINRIKSMILELTGNIALSEGTLVNWQRELGEKLEPFIDRIKLKLKAKPVLHKDETGVRINKKLHWFHVLGDKELTLYFSHPKRGKEADEQMGILSDYGGVLEHDHLKSLYHFKCQHAECNAHILRYLKAAKENQKCDWADEMAKFLVELNERKKCGEKFNLDACFAKYDEILAKARTKYYNNPQGTDYTLWKRMGEFKTEHLRFICDENVPFDNNQAERDLRMIKAKTKISGCFRSDWGSATFANTKSYTSTLRKNRHNIFDSLVLAFCNTPNFCLN